MYIFRYLYVLKNSYLLVPGKRSATVPSIP